MKEKIMKDVRGLVMLYARELDKEEAETLEAELGYIETDIGAALLNEYAVGFEEGFNEGYFERYADLRHDTEDER